MFKLRYLLWFLLLLTSKLSSQTTIINCRIQKLISGESHCTFENLNFPESAKDDDILIEGTSADKNSTIAVWIYDSQLETLPRKFLTQLPNLKAFGIFNSSLHKLSADFLAIENSLEILHLKDNNISVIDEKAFEGLKKLHTLDLSGNSLENITSNLFTDNLQLRYIEFEDNKIKKVDVNVFRDLSRLEEVNLVRNHCFNRRFFIKEGNLEPMKKALQEAVIECNKPPTTVKPKHVLLREHIFGTYQPKNIWRPLFVH